MGIQIVKFPAILTGFVFVSVFIVVTQAQLKLQIKPSLSVTDSVLHFPNEYDASKIERTKCRERADLIKLPPEAQARAEGRESRYQLRNGRISYAQALHENLQGSNYWSKEYIFAETTYPFSIAQTSDFTFLIAGYLNWETYSRRSFILNIDSDGNIIWKYLYHDPSKEVIPLPNIYFPWLLIQSISPADDGGSFISGALVEERNNFIAVLAKISSSGDVEWSTYFKASSFVTFDTINQTNDGGLIISGKISGKGSRDIWVLKLSSAGEIEWQYAYGGPGMESDFFDFPKNPSIIQAADGGYLLAGDSDSFSFNEWPDLWILKLSEKGDIEWQKSYGGLQSDYLAFPGHHIKETATGDIYVAATTISFSNPPQ
ncbi:hypothetical protein KA005_39400, partial [bacterium]|nr:hypothetical protein [bacterium]